jgi:hypothetical protein
MHRSDAPLDRPERSIGLPPARTGCPRSRKPGSCPVACAPDGAVRGKWPARVPRRVAACRPVRSPVFGSDGRVPLCPAWAAPRHLIVARRGAKHGRCLPPVRTKRRQATRSRASLRARVAPRSRPCPPCRPDRARRRRGVADRAEGVPSPTSGAGVRQRGRPASFRPPSAGAGPGSRWRWPRRTDRWPPDRSRGWTQRRQAGARAPPVLKATGRARLPWVPHQSGGQYPTRDRISGPRQAPDGRPMT